ncbi:MAG TPA: hypothetical protein VFX15_03660 [Actinomycetes bacterium]|nr:hypothetical protein [Actinomycetes bacterium]
MSKPSWTHPQCEKCWMLANVIVDDEGVATSIRRPVRATEMTVEECAWCGDPTISGIFVREDPANVEFPAMEPDDG